ncbi:hypothetical protein GCM10018777_11700 [Streptomyces albogriseolus]|uniref:hypothetical protein n=1 Tax=Streptomyces albogriseolus TaxID=1887 RepID=UPI0019B03A74|nr:hypothetical protein [Streptomyces viridodiastaticus]MCX4570600.1 hypothetical protein [Streptomyces viridodiastaticus]GHG02500.1 hypothetical protein GCM10018777_11700 [Streptomyces viridodiastaticus]
MFEDCPAPVVQVSCQPHSRSPAARDAADRDTWDPPGEGDEASRRSRSALDTELGFEGYATTRADQMSGDTLSKLNLALALLADPEVLLDEPYVGFDFDTYLRFWDLVAQRRQSGRSVLIISHFVTDERRFDRILHLRDSRTVPKQPRRPPPYEEPVRCWCAAS